MLWASTATSPAVAADPEIDSVYQARQDTLLHRIFDLTYSSPIEALPYLRESEILAKEEKDTAWLVLLNVQNARIEAKLGNYQYALDLYLQSLDYYKSNNQLNQEADIYNGAAIVYHDIGDYEQAQVFYDKAYQIYRELDYKPGESMLLNNYGDMYFDAGDYTSARENYLKALDINRELGWEADQATPLHNIGRVYAKMKDYESAISYLNQALKLDTAYGVLDGVGLDYKELGNVYLDAGLYDQALLNYEKSLDVAENMGIRPLKLSTLQALSQLYKVNGNPRKALNYFEYYLALKDSMLNENVQRDIAQAQTRFELDQKDKEIQYLELQQEIDENTIRDRNIKLSIGTGLALLILIITGILYSRFRIKVKIKNQMEGNNSLIDERSTELKETNQKLKHSKAKLKELNSTKDKFFSIISHDLKSPLRSLSGLFRILIDHADKLSREEIMALTGKLDHSVSNLSVLLDNLLQWSMTQMGSVSYQPSSIDIAEPITETVRLLKPEADHKNINLSLKVEDNGEVFADRNMVTFIIRNLVSNAIKFTPSGGEIQVFIFEQKGYFIVKVKDDGVGIPEENINKLFRLETSFTTAGTQQEKGTGLGLILCREFAMKNGGDISIESEEGRGAAFTISLPKAHQGVPVHATA